MNNGNDMAFPDPMDYGSYRAPDKGLTKLEYFAAKAMQGLLANAKTHANGFDIEGARPSRIAMSAVNYATALIDALEVLSQPSNTTP